MRRLFIPLIAACLCAAPAAAAESRPAPAAEDLAREAKVSVSTGKGARLLDAEPGTVAVLGKGGSWAEMEFPAPREPRSVVVTYATTAEKGGGAPVVCNVMVPDENGGWHTVLQRPHQRTPPLRHRHLDDLRV